jgi:cation diffusion facilitator family transporter
MVAPHSHDAKDSLDQALEGSKDGIRAVAISLCILLLTAGIQAIVVETSGSVALLGDTLHNAADALTAVPLWLAFRLGRRAPTSRFTYGYGKAEDVAGLAVLALIFGSAAFAGYEAIDRLVHPQKITHLGFVMAAAVVGTVGNGVVAQYRIRVGRRIGSAALEADGIHARTDGVTSLLVLIGAIAVALGAQWADAVVGLVITAAILVVGYQAAQSVGQRLLDAVDPGIVARISATVAAADGVVAVTEVRARWMGHRLLAQVRLSVDGPYRSRKHTRLPRSPTTSFSMTSQTCRTPSSMSIPPGLASIHTPQQLTIGVRTSTMLPCLLRTWRGRLIPEPRPRPSPRRPRLSWAHAAPAPATSAGISSGFRAPLAFFSQAFSTNRLLDQTRACGRYRTRTDDLLVVSQLL